MRRPFDIAKWRMHIRELRELCPLRHAAVVRRVALVSGYGTCDYRHRRFHIRIDRELETDAALHFLVHEWAHAMAWNDSDWKADDHGPEWGVMHSRAYQAVFEH